MAISPACLVVRTFVVEGQEVLCRFFEPVAAAKDFQCRYEIAWPEGAVSRTIYGIDGVQSLLLALQTAHADLLIARQDGRDVTWLGGRNLGLPIPEALRDLVTD